MDTESSDAPNREALFAHVKQSLTNADFSFNAVDELTYLTLPFTGKILDYQVIVFVGEGYITSVGRLPVKVPGEKVSEILAILNERNTDLPIGNFEYYERLLAVQFKLGLSIKEKPSNKVVVGMVLSASGAIEGITPTILKAIT